MSTGSHWPAAAARETLLRDLKRHGVSLSRKAVHQLADTALDAYLGAHRSVQKTTSQFSAIEAVREMHTPPTAEAFATCPECRTSHPCRTLRTINEHNHVVTTAAQAARVHPGAYLLCADGAVRLKSKASVTDWMLPATILFDPDLKETP